MDIFDKFQYGESSVDLTSVAQEIPKPITIPLASVRNRAATTVLLNPNMEDPIRQYDTLVSEGEQGVDYTHSVLRQDIEKRRNVSNIKGVMDLLADDTVDLETKRSALAFFKNSPILNDASNDLFAATLSADVKGENKDAEAARVSGAELFGEIYQARNTAQGLVNAHAASLDGVSFKTLGELIDLSVVPFSMSSQVVGLKGKMQEREGQAQTAWDKVKTFFASGSTKADIIAKIDSLPPAEQVKFLKGLYEDIAASGKTMFSNDNQFAQFMNALELTQPGGYSFGEKILDNISPFLDVLGIGYEYKAYKVGKAARALQKEIKAVEATKAAQGAAEAAVGPPRPLPGEEGFSSPFAAQREAKQAVAQKQIDFDPNLPTESKPEGAIPGILSPRTEGVSFLEGGTGTKAVSAEAPQKQTASLFKEPPSKVETSSTGVGNQYTINDAISADGPTSETVKLITDGNGNTAIVRENGDVIDITNMIKAGFTPERAIAQTLGDDTSGKNVLKTSTKNPLQEGVSTLLGGTGRKVEEEPKKKIAALFQRIETNSVVRAENPASPAKIVQQTNPDKAAAMHEIVMKSEGDEAANALYGTTKVDAIASDVLPQATTIGGAVTTRPANIQINLRTSLEIPTQITDFLDDIGGSHFGSSEISSARANVEHRFNEVTGLTMNPSMSTFATDGGRIQISAVYHPGEGAWSNAREAVDQARLALRKTNVKEEEIILLKKEGLDHVPTTLEEVGDTPGNYLIRIETNHEVDPTDVTSWMDLDVKRNFLDRNPHLVSNDGGSATKYFLDAASTLHPIITGPAAAATYKASALEKLLLDLAADYGDRWKGLDKAGKDKVDAYIRYANYNEVPYDPVALLAQGWKQEELDTAKAWRAFWDTHYFLENSDLVKTLNSQRYELFIGPGTELVAKSIVKNTTLGAEVQGNRVIGGTKLYNPSTNTVTVLTKTEIDDLYNTNGTLAKLRRPTTFNGEVAEYMIVRNTPTEYLRKMRDTDPILNYKNGYFQIQYTAPKFIDEILERDNLGVATKWRTLAVAGDSLEAEHFKRRLASTTAGKTIDDFRVRGDERALTKDSDSWWDVNSAGGRIAQRTRGKLLENSVVPTQLGEGHVLNPVDSATRAARSIAGRVVTRPVLEAAKIRAIRQYAQAFPSDGMGGRKWPSNVGQIGETGEASSELVRDARTTWEHINYLENGYINGMDNVFKAFLNSIATKLGKLAVSKDSKLVAGLERAATLSSDVGPISLTKNFVFFNYLAANPLRQLLVQPHQIIRTFAYNPAGWISGGVHKLMMGYLAGYAGVKNLPADVVDFTNFLTSKGILANVDKQNLVRGVLRDAADSSNKVWKAVGQTAAIPRKIGFDTGERANMLGHAAAVYDKFKREGKNVLDARVREEMVAEMSAISYGMNFAEDMVYNQTSAALILQFMQVPHKAFLQMTNRRIPPAMRLRMAVADMFLWGPPTLLISDMLGGDILPDNPKAREALIWGMESMLLNQMFQTLSGEDTNIDLSSNDPRDYTGWLKIFEAVKEGGLQELILSSPAANLLFKDGSKAQVAILTMARFFSDQIDPIDPNNPVKFTTALHTAADMMSGYSNAMKAYFLLQTRQRVNAQGVKVEEDVDTYEAIAQVFGFGGMETKELYTLQSDLFKSKKEMRENALKVYKDVKTYYYTQLSLPDTDPKMVTAVTAHLISLVKKNPEMAAVFNEQMMRDFQGKDKSLLYLMLQSSGIVTRDQVRRTPGLTEEERKMLDEIIVSTGNARKELIEAQK